MGKDRRLVVRAWAPHPLDKAHRALTQFPTGKGVGELSISTNKHWGVCLLFTQQTLAENFILSQELYSDRRNKDGRRLFVDQWDHVGKEWLPVCGHVKSSEDLEVPSQACAPTPVASGAAVEGLGAGPRNRLALSPSYCSTPWI